MNGISSKIAGVAVAVSMLGTEVNAGGRSDEISWERDNRSRKEQAESPIAQYRLIQPPRDIVRRGDAFFGKAFQIVTPSEGMAKTFKLPQDYKSNLYAWVGAPAASIRRSGQLNGAIILMDLNTGEDYATIYSPNKTDGHGFGWGLKLSPDGKLLGIESAAGFAAILNQETGKVVLLEHPDFMNHLRAPDGKYYPDTKMVGRNHHCGCRLEFLPNDQVIVSGVYVGYVGHNEYLGRHETKFNIFNTSGEFIYSITGSGAYPDSSYSNFLSYCFGTTGPNLVYNQNHNLVYYITETMFDPGLKGIMGCGSGRVAAFDLSNNFEAIKMSIFPDATSQSFIKPSLNARTGEFYTFHGSILALSQAGDFENLDPNNAGKVLLYSIDDKSPDPIGEISIGKQLEKPIRITSMLALNSSKILVAYYCADGDNYENYLGICDLTDQSFKRVEGFVVKEAAHGISEMKINPHNKTGILLGIPGYQDIQGQIMEVKIKDEYFYQNLYENSTNQ